VPSRWSFGEGCRRKTELDLVATKIRRTRPDGAPLQELHVDDAPDLEAAAPDRDDDLPTFERYPEVTGRLPGGCAKIEFSFLNRNLMVWKSPPLIS
jgi:hypothetical protein